MTLIDEFPKKYKFRNDYRLFDYEIPSIKLNFVIEKNKVSVISEYKLIKRNLKTKKIVLKGIDIKLEEICLNNKSLNKSGYSLNNEELIIRGINKKVSSLKIKCSIIPRDNTNLLGMYESNEIITTQCEAEGFRRIAFHPDRPDILSKYTVRIIANKNNYPTLLSNGNLIHQSLLEEDMHEVVWEDPHPKPSYLFALVAGKLECINDIYITKRDRKISIKLYVEPGGEASVEHAINSLKKAMRWDEEKYNLEYDLDLFNIVAIRHFNMGAMENKSLNIFNSKLILANEETTTDDELEKIEGVVAHEYFHNWTGNRVTCRDWFQLSLKEGLTVYRDQEFSADMHNNDLKRIEDIKFLRKNQFKEDSGATSHPVRPEKYIEIDNFYTTTIYEKGAEIIRMSKAIVKSKNFKDGFSSYIKKYDGEAATIDEFIECIFENSKEVDIEQFKLWYQQNGTPDIEFKRNWNKKENELTLLIKQSNNNKNNPINKFPLVIPIKLAVFSDKNNYETHTFILKKKEDKLIFKNLDTKLNQPIISLFRGFSAPVNWESDLTLDEELFIIENDTDLFSVYNSVVRIYKLIITTNKNNLSSKTIEEKFIKTIKSILLNNKHINNKLLSEILTIPTFVEIESEVNDIDPIKLYEIIDKLNYKLSNLLEIDLLDKWNKIEKKINKKWPEGSGERKLINTIWKLLLHTNDRKLKQKVLSFVDNKNMTLSKSALNSFQKFKCEERLLASEMFFEKWKDNKLVLDNWFYFMAGINNENSIASIELLFKNKYFDEKSPNTLRSILNGYVLNNRSFHNKDGSGYLYVAKKIVRFDNINPIVVSRFLKVFSHWHSYVDPYRKHMLMALKYIDRNELSNNTREVINMILNK